MHPLLFNKKIDLVDFDDVQLFMFQNDNLYDIAVAANRKNQSVVAFQQKIQETGYPTSPVTPQNITGVVSARYGIYLYLNHLWQNAVDFTILDIGCFVGSFSIKLGNFVRTFAQPTKIIAFDPTEAGELARYNIKLNGLNDIISHEVLAVSDTDGLVLFHGVSGHADSTAIATAANIQAFGFKRKLRNMMRTPLHEKYAILKRRMARIAGVVPPLEEFDLIATSTRIPSFLRVHHIDNHLFVKIDVEGFDAVLINQLLPLMSDRLVSIIFEFTPSRYRSIKEAEDYLLMLSQRFHLFDLFYAPNPTWFRLIAPERIQESVAAIQATRKYSYTDVFLLDKRTPDCAQILSRLLSLQEDPAAMIL